MQVIVVAALFAVVGVVLGVMSPVTIPITYARYTAVALLAALDSIFGAFKAYIAGTFEPRVFFSGLLTNMTLAAGLVYFGDKLGVDLSIAAIVAFGVRIFNNLGAIRRHYLSKRKRVLDSPSGPACHLPAERGSSRPTTRPGPSAPRKYKIWSRNSPGADIIPGNPPHHPTPRSRRHPSTLCHGGRKPSVSTSVPAGSPWSSRSLTSRVPR